MSGDEISRIIDAYARDAPQIIDRYLRIESAHWLAPVLSHLPPVPARLLDVGAGVGRDAAFLRDRGYTVTAVEPVPPFRAAARAGAAERHVTWVNDRLPDLSTLTDGFDVILLAGVWHHLPPTARQPALARLRALLSENGGLVVAVRHGPCAVGRTGYPTRLSDVIEWAKALGLTLSHHAGVDSLQDANRRAGVRWDWLVFRVRAGRSA